MRAHTRWGRVAWWINTWGLVLLCVSGVGMLGVGAWLWWSTPPPDDLGVGVLWFGWGFSAWASLGLVLVIAEMICWRIARRRRN